MLKRWGTGAESQGALESSRPAQERELHVLLEHEKSLRHALQKNTDWMPSEERHMKSKLQETEELIESILRELALHSGVDIEGADL